jgi:two-component system, cell cycle sensor histidine kinase and response regulator CckA
MGSPDSALTFSAGNELSVTLFEEAGDALFLFDPDTEEIYDVNPMAQRLSGFSRAELRRLQITYLFRSEQQGGLQRLRHAYKKTGIFHSQEGFLLRHQQEELWIPVNLTVTRLHGEPKTLGLVTARDIREHREMFAQLQRMDAELRRVLAAVSDCLWSAEIDSTGRMTYRYYSPVVEHITGRPPEYFLASPERWLSLIHTDDRARLHKSIMRIKGGHSTCEETEYRILHPSGTTRWVRDSIRASRNGHEGILRLDGVVTDISKNKEAEEALRASEKRFRALVEKSTDAVALLDAEGVILYASPSTQTVLGYAPEEFISRNGLEAIHPEDLPRIKRLFAQLLTEPGKSFTAELRYPHKDGSWRHIEGTGINRLEDLAVRAVVINYRDVTQRREAQAALRESEERFRQLVENSNDLICETDSETRLTYLSPNYQDVLGYEPNELLGQKVFDFVHPDDFPAVLADLNQAKSAPAVYRFRHKDGQWRWFESTGKSFQRSNGEVRVVIFSRDITIRKQAEEELARERDLLRILMESVPHFIYFKDQQSRYTRINNAQMANLGLRQAQQAVGRTDFDFYPAELAEEFHADESRILQTGIPLVDKVERQTGVDATERWLLSTKVPIVDRKGQISGIVGISRDITERKRAEEALRASEAKYRTLIENLEQNIFLKDEHLRFIAVNRVFCRHLGLPEAEIIGKTDFDFYPAHLAEKYRADDRLVLTEGKRLELEEQNLDGGQVRTVRVVKTPVKDDQGKTEGVLGIFWDVTEQRALEAQLRQAQKMEAVGQLAGGVAHDFNNLLTVILGNVTLVQAGLGSNDANGQLLTLTEKAALRAAELTRKLLGFSRQTTLRLESTDLTSAVEETVALLRRTIDPRISLVTRLHSGVNGPHAREANGQATPPWLVQADLAQINQVLMNLCLNARDAMPTGGQLTLEMENVNVTDEMARLHLEARVGDFVRLRVRDTGEGISPDVLPRIFEPFFTTKGPGKGTGLGLAMVFGIIKQHQGWIECTSQVGEGTCFDMYLPRHTALAEENHAAAPDSAPQPGSETILLVDDEPMIRYLGRTILQRYGYQVLLAEDGVEALKIYQGQGRPINLVVLDLTMPRMSGRDVFQKLVEIDPAVRVLLASGYSADHIVDWQSDRIFGFVGKPYRPDDLAHQVRAALDRKTEADGKDAG